MKPRVGGNKRSGSGKKPRVSGKVPEAMRRLSPVACVILGWAVYRTTRNYYEHGRWDPIDLVSTALGAGFGMLDRRRHPLAPDRIAAKQWH